METKRKNIKAMFKYTLNHIDRLKAENAALSRNNAELHEQNAALAESYRTLSATKPAAPPSQAFFENVPLPDGFPPVDSHDFTFHDFASEDIKELLGHNTGEPKPLATGKPYPSPESLQGMHAAWDRHCTPDDWWAYRLSCTGKGQLYTAEDVMEMCKREGWTHK